MTATRILAHLCAMLAIQSSTPALAQPAATGYVGWWMADGWRPLAHQELKRLYFFDIGLLADGSLSDRHGWPDQWADLRAFAHERQIPIEVCVTLMSPSVFARLFSNPVAVQRLLDQLQALALSPGTAGLHLDIEMYETLADADVREFRKFVQTLVVRLGALQSRRTVSIFLPFQTKSQLYDSASLQNIEHVVVQGYDSHWLESKSAGPIAPLDGPYALTWKRAVAAADALAIPRNRQFLSFPLYGYEWRVRGNAPSHNPTQGKGHITTFAAPVPPGSGVPTPPIIAMERVARYGATFDPVSASSYYRYKNTDGQQWEGWFEDWWGLQQKRDYIGKEGLGGLAFFLLGYDNAILVQSYLQSKSHQAPARPQSGVAVSQDYAHTGVP